MTTSEHPTSPPEGLPWARASLKLSGHHVDQAAFDRIVDQLGVASGEVAVTDRGGAGIWVDNCPLPSDAPVADQFAWAVDEAEAVFGGSSADLVECQAELWLGIGVGAQLGVLCDSTSLARLARLGIDVVLDLYGWE